MNFGLSFFKNDDFLNFFRIFFSVFFYCTRGCMHAMHDMNDPVRIPWDLTIITQRAAHKGQIKSVAVVDYACMLLLRRMYYLIVYCVLCVLCALLSSVQVQQAGTNY